MRLNALSSMTAPMKESNSETSPTLSLLRSAISPSLIFGHNDSGMYAREHAEHFCPQYSKAERMVEVITESGSADG